MWLEGFDGFFVFAGADQSLIGLELGRDFFSGLVDVGLGISVDAEHDRPC